MVSHSSFNDGSSTAIQTKLSTTFFSPTPHCPQSWQKSVKRFTPELQESMNAASTVYAVVYLPFTAKLQRTPQQERQICLLWGKLLIIVRTSEMTPAFLNASAAISNKHRKGRVIKPAIWQLLPLAPQHNKFKSKGVMKQGSNILWSWATWKWAKQMCWILNKNHMHIIDYTSVTGLFRTFSNRPSLPIIVLSFKEEKKKRVIERTPITAMQVSLAIQPT